MLKLSWRNTDNTPRDTHFGNTYRDFDDKLHRDGGPAIIQPDGTEEWYQHGRLHREDGPAFTDPNGNEFWYWKGRLHRDNDLPAVERANGDSEWYRYGRQHRENGRPDIERANGDSEWHVKGKLHRLGGPAIEKADGEKLWWVNDIQHRLDGPAVERSNIPHTEIMGSPLDQSMFEWWVDGKRYTELEFNEIIAQRTAMLKLAWKDFPFKEDLSDIEIVNIDESDKADILQIEDTQGNTPEVVKYIQDNVNWGLSVKAVERGVMVGYYLLSNNPISSIDEKGVKYFENIENYKDKSGTEGVSLYVKPEYRKLGIASLLKDYAENTGSDYVWGYQSKYLDNLEHWEKRRKYFADTGKEHVTLKDIDNSPSPESVKLSWKDPQFDTGVEGNPSEFFNVDKCDRCSGPLDQRIMSWFNNDTICMECSATEDKIKQSLPNRGADHEGIGYVPNIESNSNLKLSWQELPEGGEVSVEEIIKAVNTHSEAMPGNIIRPHPTEFYRLISKIPYKQLVPGTKYADSYNRFNDGMEIMVFNGFSSEGKIYSSMGEIFAKYGVRSLRALEDMKADVKMNCSDNKHTGNWFYIFEGRWSRGSGAEALTFWSIEEVVLPHDDLSTHIIGEQKRAVRRILGDAAYIMHSNGHFSWETSAVVGWSKEAPPEVEAQIDDVVTRVVAWVNKQPDPYRVNGADIPVEYKDELFDILKEYDRNNMNNADVATASLKLTPTLKSEASSWDSVIESKPLHNGYTVELISIQDSNMEDLDGHAYIVRVIETANPDNVIYKDEDGSYQYAHSMDGYEFEGGSGQEEAGAALAIAVAEFSAKEPPAGHQEELPFDDVTASLKLEAAVDKDAVHAMDLIERTQNQLKKLEGATLVAKHEIYHGSYVIAAGTELYVKNVSEIPGVTQVHINNAIVTLDFTKPGSEEIILSLQYYSYNQISSHWYVKRKTSTSSANVTASLKLEAAVDTDAVHAVGLIEGTFLEEYETIIFDLDGTIWDVLSDQGDGMGAYETRGPYKLQSRDVVTDIEDNVIQLHKGISEMLDILDLAGKNLGIMSRGEAVDLPFEAQPSTQLLKKFEIYGYFNYEVIYKAFGDKSAYVRPRGKTLFIDDDKKNIDSVNERGDVDVLDRKAFNNWLDLLSIKENEDG